MKHLDSYTDRVMSILNLISIFLLVLCEYLISTTSLFEHYKLEIVFVNGVVFSFLLIKLLCSNVSKVIIELFTHI